MKAWLGRPAALFGAVVLAVVVLLSVFAPWVAPYDPLATSWSLVRKAMKALAMMKMWTTTIRP